ncbi:hypothetical protein IW262DRAFT_881226 [Armillaria fumosa]|nr:hypothetical protein IW262DRAFT_881226 [Armillaria fumosa]
MTNHGAETTGEAMDIAERLDSPAHRKRRDCNFARCYIDQAQKDCDNPHRCAVAAKTILDRITEKWDPRLRDSNDGLELTPEDRHQNIEEQENGGEIHFDPNIDRDCSLAEGFRIFTTIWNTCTQPARRATRADDEDGSSEEVSTAYTDGSAYNNGTEAAYVGAIRLIQSKQTT